MPDTLGGVMLRNAWFALALAACGKAAAPPPPPAHVAKPLTGIWLGTLHAGSKELRVQIHLDLAAKPAGCTLDSLDQRAMGIPCGNVVANATSLSLDVPAVKGALTGTVATDGNTVTGTWTQGGAPLPVVLTRQAKAVEAAKVALDPAMPPVDIEKLQSVMDADLAKLVAGELAPATGIGVTIGVVAHGERKIWTARRRGDRRPRSRRARAVVRGRRSRTSGWRGRATAACRTG